MHRKISVFPLALLIIAAIDSIRNLPSAAIFGSSLVFFFLLAAILFLFPTALVAAELTAAFPEKGGIYHWVQMAFGEKWGMLAIWFQWINTMVWYPTMLSFIAGTFAYLINPDLVGSKLYLALMIIGIFWLLTLVSLRGTHFSTTVNMTCALLGTIIPMVFLMILGIIWIASGKSMQISLKLHDIIPSIGQGESWISLTAIMASFLGMELAGVHILDVKNPQKNFPKVLMLSAFFILISMLCGSLAIAVVIPDTRIGLVAGVAQVFQQFFHEFNMPWCQPLMVLAIVIGSVGSIISWQTSPAKGLLHAAEFGYLPSFFVKKNRHGVPVNIMIVQAILVSFCCLAFLLIPSINGFYWFLTALSTDIYMLMYILLFCAAFRLRKMRELNRAIFRIPGRKIGLGIVCLLGFAGCAMTMAVSFIPPAEVEVGGYRRYMLSMALAILLTILSVFIFFLYKKMNPKQRLKGSV